MFVFTVLFSKYFEVHAELYGIRKFIFWKVGRDLKSLGTTDLNYITGKFTARLGSHPQPTQAFKASH